MGEPWEGGPALGNPLGRAPRAHPEPTRDGAGAGGAGPAPRSPRRSRSTISRPPHAGVCAPAPPPPSPAPVPRQSRAPAGPAFVRPTEPGSAGRHGGPGPGRGALSGCQHPPGPAPARAALPQRPRQVTELCRGGLTPAAPFPNPGFSSTQGDRALWWGLPVSSDTAVARGCTGFCQGSAGEQPLRAPLQHPGRKQDGVLLHVPMRAAKPCSTRAALCR